MDMLKEKIKDYHTKWTDVKKKFESESKLELLGSEDREEIFRSFIKKLKSETKSKEKKKKREKKEKARQKERERAEKSRKEKDAPLDDDILESNERKNDKADESNGDKMEDISVIFSIFTILVAKWLSSEHCLASFSTITP